MPKFIKKKKITEKNFSKCAHLLTFFPVIGTNKIIF